MKTTSATPSLRQETTDSSVNNSKINRIILPHEAHVLSIQGSSFSKSKPFKVEQQRRKKNTKKETINQLLGIILARIILPFVFKLNNRHSKSTSATLNEAHLIRGKMHGQHVSPPKLGPTSLTKSLLQDEEISS